MVYKEVSMECSSCHSNPHKPRINSQCQPCHTPQAWKPKVKFWQTISFNHAQLRYPLEGKHLEVACIKCHPKNKWKEIPYKNCISCHEDKHRKQFGKKDCQECHQLTGWKPSTYDLQRHREAKYVPDKLHSTLQCQKCHEKDQYLPLPRTCAGCHNESARFYQGVYGAGLIPPGPDLMSKSVTCSDCHNELPSPNPKLEIKKRCQKCHNSNYVKWFEAWEEILSKKETELENIMKKSAESQNGLAKELSKVKKILETIKREKYHNPLYAHDLLDYCLNLMQP